MNRDWILWQAAFIAGTKTAHPDIPEEAGDRVSAEEDGCPTEKAVLQRFWRTHNVAQPD
jgi:hypothetical protein